MIKPEMNYYKDCKFKSNHNYNDLHMSDIKEGINFTEDSDILYNLNQNENTIKLLKIYDKTEHWVYITLLRHKRVILKLKSS